MPVNENISGFLNRYKQAKHLSIAEFAEELGIAKSILECYLNGTGNPRAGTLELLAKKLGVSVAEIVSDPLPGQEQTETIIRAAKELAGLLPERRERGLQLFHDMMDLFAEGDRN